MARSRHSAEQITLRLREAAAQRRKGLPRRDQVPAGTEQVGVVRRQRPGYSQRACSSGRPQRL